MFLEFRLHDKLSFELFSGEYEDSVYDLFDFK